MTTKELKRLSRMELLEVLLRQIQEGDRLKEENTELKQLLESRKLQVAQAGNLAEASLSINRVMEAAQAAAEQYLENLRDMETTARQELQEQEEKTRRRCTQAEEETKARCLAMEKDALRRCAQLEAAAQRKCDEMLGIARAQAPRSPKKQNRKKGGR